MLKKDGKCHFWRLVNTIVLKVNHKTMFFKYIMVKAATFTKETEWVDVNSSEYGKDLDDFWIWVDRIL